MFFFLDHTVAKMWKGRKSPDEQAFFTKLAFARREEKCLLHGDRDSLDALAADPALGALAQDIYRSLSEKNNDRAFVKKISPIFALTYQADCFSEEYQNEFFQGALARFKEDKDKFRFIPIPELLKQRWKLDDAPILLGESYWDCKFYNLIAKWYLREHNINGIGLGEAYERFRNGGGSSVENVLAEIIPDDPDKEKKPTLCITDSDVRYGGYKEDELPPPKKDNATRDKAERFETRLQENNALPFFLFIILRAHEIENLIPLSVMRELGQKALEESKSSKSSNKQKKTRQAHFQEKVNDALSLLDKMESFDKGKPLLYYDFKDGLYKLSQAEKDYWVTTVGLLPKSQPSAPSMEFVNTEKALELLEAEIAAPSQGKKKNLMIPPYLRPHWQKLGQAVFSWCCAGTWL